MPQVLDGRRIAETIRAETAAGVVDFTRRHGAAPTLATVLVGNNPASHVYVKSKIKACEEVGIRSEAHHLPAGASEHELLALLSSLNQNRAINGILLQLPLPEHISKTHALDTIEPAKDVDGLHPWNAGLLVQGRARLIACTPLGVIEILKRSSVPLAGRDAVVLGRSDLVGKPLALLLMHENATVTLCHSKTHELARTVSQADIVVAAIGKPAFVTPEYVKEGAVVIDVGTSVLGSEQEIEKIFGAGSKKLEDFRNKKTVLVGDVHPAVYPKTSMYTPVPGGVGPLTIAMLLRNTLTAATDQTSGH